jgi:hypothetical protein
VTKQRAAQIAEGCESRGPIRNGPQKVPDFSCPRRRKDIARRRHSREVGRIYVVWGERVCLHMRKPAPNYRHFSKSLERDVAMLPIFGARPWCGGAF